MCTAYSTVMYTSVPKMQTHMGHTVHTTTITHTFVPYAHLSKAHTHSWKLEMLGISYKHISKTENLYFVFVCSSIYLSINLPISLSILIPLYVSVYLWLLFHGSCERMVMSLVYIFHLETHHSCHTHLLFLSLLRTLGVIKLVGWCTGWLFSNRLLLIDRSQLFWIDMVVKIIYNTHM